VSPRDGDGSAAEIDLKGFDRSIKPQDEMSV
jgi:hypothetical protein